MPLRTPKVKVIDVIDILTGEVVGDTSFSFVPKDVFWLDGSYWVGVQTEAWEQDEENWDNLERGQWLGPGIKRRPSPIGSQTIIRQYVKNLSVTGATYENTNPDDIAHVDAGDFPLTFEATIPEGNSQIGSINGDYIYEIINTVTGELLTSGSVPKIGNGVGIISTTPNITFTDGSFVARVKIHAPVPYSLPPGYVAPTKYTYKEDNVTYVYDPSYNIGRIPSDPNHPLLLERARMIEEGITRDKPEWITYLVGSGSVDGEWSALKIQVGEGVWDWDQQYQTSVGPVLKRINEDDLSDFTFINFDPMARSISASIYVDRDITDRNSNVIVEEGSYVFGGNRSTRSGPVMAIWVMRKPENPGDLPVIDLLGTDLNPSTGACECALLDHSTTSFKINEAGELYILSKCSLHVLDSNQTTIDKRLPGIPENSNGNPGGQALNIIGDRIYFFSEYFGQFGTQSSVHFYNFLVDQVGDKRTTGDGTVFHGPNCAESWMNKLWGIYQDKPSSDITAKQYLAFYSGKTWAKKPKPGSLTEFIIDSGVEFSANEYNWQRVIEANNVLHIFGKRGPQYSEEDTTTKANNFQDGVFAVSDGKSFSVLDFDYRILKANKTPSNDLDTELDKLEKVLAIGHKVETDDDGISVVDINKYYIIEIDYRGEPQDFEYNPFSGCFISDVEVETTEEGIINSYYKYLWWVDNKWVGRDFIPTDPTVCYLTRTVMTSGDGDTGGYIAYCDQSTDRFPKDNDAFIWNGSAYSILSEDVRRYYKVNIPETELPLFLVWSPTELSWIPLDVIPEDNTEPVLTRTSGEGFVSYSGPDYPYTIDADHSSLEYGGRRGWVPRPNPEPILIYSNSGKFNLELISRYGISYSDLPDYLTADYDNGVWAEASIAPTDGKAYLSKGSDGDIISYTPVPDIEHPYNYEDWYTRGLAREGNVWKVVNIKPTIFSWDVDDKKFIANNLYGTSYDDLPDYAVWTGIKEWTFTDIVPDTNYLIKGQIDGLIYYEPASGFVVPYDTKLWFYRGLVLGTESLIVTAVEPPVFIWNNYDKNFSISITELEYEYYAKETDFPAYLIYTSNEKWMGSNTIPINGSYLKRMVDGDYLSYQLTGSQGGVAQWPYDASKWPKRGLININGIWQPKEIDPPIVVWDNISESFSVDLDHLYNTHGIKDLSEFSNFLIWSSSVNCWSSSDEAVGYYLIKTIDRDQLRYAVDFGETLPLGYNLTDFPAIWLNYTEDSCPVSIEPPTLKWDANISCNDTSGAFYADREELIEGYGIVNLTSLPENIIWDSTCWNSGTPVDGDIYLNRVITPTKVIYCVPSGIDMPYNPDDINTEGNALSLGWDGKACPVFTCPPYNYETCSVIRLIGNENIRGNIVDNEFVPCDCIDAWDCFNGLPVGSKWKVIKLIRHGLPINVIELIDSNIDLRLEKTDNKGYGVAWYRTSGPDYNDDVETYLKTFTKRINYSRIEYLKTPCLNDIEIVILVTPKVVKTKLPVILRLI
jgi:hypothetical protein